FIGIKMKICPKCNKPNPDDIRKCFFCSEDLTDVLPFVPEPVPEIEEPDEEAEFEEEEEETGQEELQEPPKPSLRERLKISIKLPDSLNVAAKLLPLSSAIIFILTVFVTACDITYFVLEKNSLKAIITGIIIFGLGATLSLSLLWMNALIRIFREK
ncbi:MAG: hypothetical protein KBT47_08105, partial [Armatimonadetes bacterium]|nr:hypothetical protein [Candidatus Hippobium faecium]